MALKPKREVTVDRVRKLLPLIATITMRYGAEAASLYAINIAPHYGLTDTELEDILISIKEMAK